MSLTDQQKLFVKYYVDIGKPGPAAKKAGYAVKSAGKTARTMLKENKAVIEAIEVERAKRDPNRPYDLKAAMAECDEQIEMARATENAAAFLGGVKLKAQLMKILDDKPAGAAFQINISGIGGADGEKTVISVSQPSVNLLTGDGDA